MENLLKQFKALTDDEKIAFMKEAMPLMAEVFGNDPQKMMSGDEIHFVLGTH